MSNNADRSFLRAALDDLPEYLTSKTLFWPLSNPLSDLMPGGLPRLTPGNLLLATARLRAEKLLDPTYEAKISQLINKNRAVWLLKVEQEFATRLRMWQNELDEFSRENGPDQAFIYQIRQRAILRLLELEIPTLKPSDIRTLDLLDEIFRKTTIPSPFVWEETYSNGFPPDEWWFLYRDLPGNRHGSEKQ
ncbi:MAG TPA: hypothetical protein VN376_09065 [Longilinea sp.]|nr:hypothetical protein [Longilinea sp.]